MAKLYITEFAFQGGGESPLPLGQQPVIAEQTIAIGGASVQSAVFNAATRFVTVSTDAICSIKFGTDPTATTDSMRLAADQSVSFGVQAGLKVAVISNT